LQHCRHPFRFIWHHCYSIQHPLAFGHTVSSIRPLPSTDIRSLPSILVNAPYFQTICCVRTL
jgi:hypothetical protein